MASSIAPLDGSRRKPRPRESLEIGLTAGFADELVDAFAEAVAYSPDGGDVLACGGVELPVFAARAGVEGPAVAAAQVITTSVARTTSSVATCRDRTIAGMELDTMRQVRAPMGFRKRVVMSPTTTASTICSIGRHTTPTCSPATTWPQRALPADYWPMPSGSRAPGTSAARWAATNRSALRSQKAASTSSCSSRIHSNPNLTTG